MTAVEFTIEKYEKFINSENGSGERYFYDELVKDIEQAKAMEKKQIMNAYGDGQQNGRECEQKLSNGEDCNVITSLQYYNETYGNEKR